MCYKKIILAVLLCFTLSGINAQQVKPSQNYKLIGKNYLEAKNYYLLTLFDQIPAVKHLLESDAELSGLAKTKAEGLTAAMKDCKEPLCFTEKIKFSDAEIALVGERLSKLYSANNALGKLVAEHLMPSGTYILYKDLTPVKLLVKAWEQDARGVNYAIEVYADGKKPNYPLIDSIAFNVKNKAYLNLLYDAAETVAAETKGSHLFFAPTLTYALQSLEINERHDAANYEPMASTVNKAAHDRVKLIKWEKYKYTLILVPGAGPSEPTVALSAEGMLRCRLAALSYFEGTAPFIMVSGGKAHPYKTKFCEAEEMKRFLITTLHVPESAILVDPHARHTTTNMRNCVRIIFRYGMPFNKPCITVTDKSQSYYITDMAARCQKELQYVPYRLGARLSDTAQEFFPLIESLQINPLEPLDP